MISPLRHIQLIKTCLAIFFITIFWTTSLFPQDPLFNKNVENRIIQELNQFQKRNKLISLSFSIFKGPHADFDYAVGYANVAKEIKATPDHIYTLASVTKTITGAVLIDLVFQNYLSLNDSACKFIHTFPEDVTVKDLLNHTSGFLREKENGKFLSPSSYRNVVDYLPIKFKSKIHRYANINYAAVGAIIEKVTKRSFSEVVQEYFYQTTQNKIYFSNHKFRRNALFVKNYVRRYRRQLLHKPVDFGLWEPAAFAQTSAKALAKFLRYHMTPEFIAYISSNSATVQKWTSSGKTITECYALGFRLRYVNGELKYIYHNGFLYGVLSTLYYFPKKDIGFVALSNMSSYPKRTLTLNRIYKIVERIIDEEFNLAIANYTIEHGYEAGITYYE
ncbi:MAG: serine hydrolase domain-containing protein, partial [bacterium]